MKMLIGLFVGLLVMTSASASNLYRFNIDGKVIMNEHVPPEYAQLGYEVLNSQGIVIRTVPPAPTAKELARRQREEARKQALLDRMKARRDADMALLRLYSAPEDVQRSRQRKIDDIDGYIGLQKRRITSLIAKLEKAQARAAQQERSGRGIPVELRLEIAKLQTQIRESHDNITRREEEKIVSTKKYAQDYQRLTILETHSIGVLEEDVKPVLAVDKTKP